MSVRIGAEADVTFTVLLTLAVFPAASIFLYSRIYVQSAFVFTVPEKVNDPVFP